MPTERWISAVIESHQDRWEEILREAVTPAVRELRTRPELEMLSFGRFNKPTWQLQLSVSGAPEWVHGCVRPLLEEHLAPLERKGTARRVELRGYDPEVDPYGGEEGTRLTERFEHHDSLACLDLMEAEAQGRLSRSRREYSVVFVEKLLDLMHLNREKRLAFYARGYRWTLSMGSFKTEDLAILDQRYETLKPGLLDLLRGEASRSQEAQWGGPEPARIARTCLDAARPILEQAIEEHAAGRIAQDPINLVWFWTGMHSNRLGLVNISEAILRYFMHRLYRDGEIEAA